MSASLKNIFAVLVHEHPDSVVNLIQNLRISDPGSRIILYDGSGCEQIVDCGINWAAMDVEFVPKASRLRWGELHEFAISAIEHAGLSTYDIMTFVDSDQLMIRRGYSDFLANKIELDFGVLTTGVCRHGPDSPLLAVRELHSEWYIWQRYLNRFANAEEAFVRSTFWPGTVVSAEAARDIAREFRTQLLQETLARSRAWATEECLIPTIAYLLGYKELLNPIDRRWCKFRTPWTMSDIDEAFAAEKAFYIHPISTNPENNLRWYIEQKMADSAI